MPTKKTKAKVVDPILETSLNSDLVEEGFKNVFGDVVSSEDSEDTEDSDDESEDSEDE